MLDTAMEMIVESLSYPEVGDGYDVEIDQETPNRIFVASQRYDATITVFMEDGGTNITIASDTGDVPSADEFTHACYEYLSEERFTVYKGDAAQTVIWQETEMEFQEDLASEIVDFIMFGIDGQ